jgi:outer membrane protein assembly factor BamD (BamD/ComL family)
MKKFCLLAPVIVAICLHSSLAVRAQGGAKQGPDINRDPTLEKDSLHNLEVARQYFKLRKAYVAALERCEEVLAANPEFSKIDEVLFIAGQSSANLADEKGKQKPNQYVIHEGEKKVTLTAEQFREKARGYFSQLVTEHPQSSFRGQADAALKELGEPKAKTVSSKQ